MPLYREVPMVICGSPVLLSISHTCGMLKSAATGGPNGQSGVLPVPLVAQLRMQVAACASAVHDIGRSASLGCSSGRRRC